MTILRTIGLTITLIGIALVFIGFLLEFIKSFKKTSKMKIGGAVLVGPFPIIFGDKDLVKYSVALLIIMLILTVFLIIVSGALP